MKQVKVIFEPGHIIATGNENMTISELATSAGVEIYKPCGGNGTCGKCKVIVENFNNPPTNQEIRLLSQEELSNNVRLACQSKINDNMKIEILTDENVKKLKILTSVNHLEDFFIDPYIKREIIELDFKNLREDDYSIIDVLLNDKKLKELTPNIKALKQISNLYNRDLENLNLAITYTSDRILSIEKSGDLSQYGVGIDIGTTTLVSYLIDIKTGEQLASTSSINPQVVHGDDVISRINYINTSEDGLSNLRNLIVDSISHQIAELCENANIVKENIYEIVINGNTIMQEIFLGINPRSIGTSPYIPTFRTVTRIKSQEVGIEINEVGLITMLPNVSGYVGSDVLSGAYIGGIQESDELKAIIDIGTNNEVIIGNKNLMLACSSAAGPAFEGARITFGMRGMPGAIEKARYEADQMKIEVIGNISPKGICGSGLIDIVSEMLRLGVLDSSGRIVSPDEIGDSDLKKRIEFDNNGIKMFRITDENSNNIYLTQKDIREVQLAKGAVYSGINILLNKLGKTVYDLQEIYLAGAFGNYIDKKNAINIGLLPNVDLNKIKPIGNSSAFVASLSVLQKNVQSDMTKMLEKIEYIELSTDMDFQQEFIKELSFPKGIIAR